MQGELDTGDPELGESHLLRSWGAGEDRCRAPGWDAIVAGG